MGDGLIPIIDDLQNKLRSVGMNDAFRLPKIIVVGAQSSGKTSVLEAIVGKEFLPRGQNMVTRRPIELQLVHPPEGGITLLVKTRPCISPVTRPGDYVMAALIQCTAITQLPARVTDVATGPEEWVVFPVTDQTRVFTDFTEVRKEIERQTEEKARGKDVSEEPIVIRVYSKNVSTVTLVDLPGLIEVAVQGQDPAVKLKIDSLVKQYARQPDNIILAVHPANVDISNCVAFAVAKEVDPRGDRTLAVITKLDAVERGTNAETVLSGDEYKVKLGIVGVVNRSQEDVNKNMTLEEARKSETEFLKIHYKSISHRHGTTFLAGKLSKLLYRHMTKQLPELLQNVNKEIQYQKTILGEVGEPINPEQETEDHLESVVSHFTANLKNIIDATFEGKNIPANKSVGSRRLYEIFFANLPFFLQEIKRTQYSREQIRTVMQNAAGHTLGIFSAEEAFQRLVKNYIQDFRDPAIRITELATEEMLRFAEGASDGLKDKTRRFPNLMMRLDRDTAEFLRDRQDETKRMVNILIDMEIAYINLNHPDCDEYLTTELNKHSRTINDSAKQTEQPVPPQAGANKSKPQKPSFSPVTAGRNAGAKTSSGISSSENSDDEDTAKEKGATTQEPPQDNTDTDNGKMPLQENQAVLRLQLQDAGRLESALEAYLRIVEKNVRDFVPKAVMLHLVNYTKEHLQGHLFRKLRKPGTNEADSNLFNEATEITARREKAILTLKALEAASSDLVGLRARGGF